MDYEKKIEKLKNPFAKGNEGCAVSMIDILEKVNEIITVLNGEAELRESEDERIRKNLIRMVGNVRNDSTQPGYYDIPFDAYISWLEKQKEQKPTELPKSEDYGIDGLYAAVDILQKTLGEVDGYQTDDGILEHKCAISAVKELYEQKPAECIEDSVKFEEGFKAGRETGLRDGQKYVLNNLDSYGSCKPAEWSEEDEVYLEDALWCVKEAERHCKDEGDKGACWSAERWLKSLRPQPKSIISDTDKSNLRDAPAIIRKSNHPFKENIALIIEKYL